MWLIWAESRYVPCPLQYHGYDSALLGIDSPVDDEEEKMDTSTQGEGPVIVSKESEDDHT